MNTTKQVKSYWEYRVNHVKVAESIIRSLLQNFRGVRFVIYPFGETGKIAKSVLNAFFGIQEYMIVDNYLSKQYDNIHSLEDLSKKDLSNVITLVSSDRVDLYDEIRESLYKIVPETKCIDLFPPQQLVEYHIYNPPKGLSECVHEQVMRESAEYILRNMHGSTQCFDNRYPLIEYLMTDKVDDSMGMFLEFGVAGGTSINFISALKPMKTIFGFDSFYGLPEDWYEDTRKGAFSTDGNIPKVRRNVKLLKGLFDETLPHFLKEHKEKCAFIHIDCDLYSSAKTVLDLLRNRIVSGTVIEFDEYFNRPRWQENEYKAFYEFVQSNNVEYEYLGYVDYGTSVAVRIK